MKKQSARTRPYIKRNVAYWSMKSNTIVPIPAPSISSLVRRATGMSIPQLLAKYANK